MSSSRLVVIVKRIIAQTKEAPMSENAESKQVQKANLIEKSGESTTSLYRQFRLEHGVANRKEEIKKQGKEEEVKRNKRRK